MSQSTIIIISLIAAFVIWVLHNQRLPYYAYALGLGRTSAYSGMRGN